MASTRALPALTRRQVLLGSAAAAAATTTIGRLALSGGDGLAGTLAAFAERQGPRLSLGFVDQVMSSGLSIPEGRPEIVPAGTIRSGGLGRRATAVLAGPTPGALDDLDVAVLGLDVLYPPEEGDEPRRFQAWSYRDEPAWTSSAVQFGVPVGVMSLGFGLTSVDAHGEEATAVLTTGAEDGLPRMRSGTYLLGLAPGMWDSRDRLPAADDPAWAGLRSLVVSIAPTP